MGDLPSDAGGRLAPWIAGLLSLLTLLALTLSMHRHDRAAHEAEFAADISAAEQSLRFHLQADSEVLRVLANEYLEGRFPSRIHRSKASELLDSKVELGCLAWVEAEGNVAWTLPGSDPCAGLSAGDTFSEMEGESQLDLWKSQAAQAGFANENNRLRLDLGVGPGGAIARMIVVYDLHRFLHQALPDYFSAENSLQPMPVGAGRLAASRGLAPGQSAVPLRAFIDLSDLGAAFGLMVEARDVGTLDTRVWLLVGLCFVLSVAMTFWMWALARAVVRRRRAQELLRAEHDNLVNVLEAMEDGVTIVSPTLDLQYVNPSLVRDFGPYRGRKCFEYFHGHGTRCSWCMMDEVLAGRAVHSRWCYPRNARTYDLIDTPVKNPDGTVSKLKIFRDITKAVETERALADSARKQKIAADEAGRMLTESLSLHRVTTALLEKESLAGVLEVVCAEARRQSEVLGAALLLLDDDSGMLRVTKMSGEAEGCADSVPVEGSFAGLAVLRNGPQLFCETARGKLADYRRERPPCIFVAPLRVDGKIIGVLDVSAARRLPQGVSRLLAHFADQAAVAIEKARLRQQAAQLAVMEERQRLARELHDSVTQTLYGVMLYADAARMASGSGRCGVAGEHIGELLNLAHDALMEVRLLVFELHPPALKDQGLLGALKMRLDNVEMRGGLATELSADDDVDELPSALGEAFYGIAREALNNVVRHGRARRVEVCVRCADTGARLTVRDDGIGFDPSSACRSGGLGIRSMRERACRVGADFRLDSTPGHGTTVVVEADRGGGERRVAAYGP